MAGALLAAMRPNLGGNNDNVPFDPAMSLKKMLPAAPSFSMRKKTLQGDWQHHWSFQLGSGKLIGDLSREMASVKESSPQYSMRPRPVNLPNAGHPGPAEYSIPPAVGSENPVSANSPAWNFGSTDRDKAFNGPLAHLPKTPSPGEYNVTQDGGKCGRANQEAVPAYSMRAKTQDQAEPEYRQTKSPRPGAGEYDVTHEHNNITGGAAPKFSMRARSATPLRSTSPGPHSYSNPSAVGSDHPSAPAAPAWQFNGPERDKAFGRVMQHAPKTPSPTQYNVTRDTLNGIGRNDQEKPPSFSMRQNTQDPAEPEYRQKRSPRPGAGEYDVTQDHVNLTRSKSPKFSMRPKPSTPIRSVSPAPGGYDISSTFGPGSKSDRKSPEWQFASSTRENAVGRIMAFVPKTPSPTSYNVTSQSMLIGRVDQEASPSYSMRPRSQDRRHDIELKEKVSPRPGAGKYNVTHDHVNLRNTTAPKFTMRSRSQTPDRRRDKLPGPASYNVRGNLVRSSSNMSIGNSTRNSPGSPCGFGSSKRFADTKPDKRVYTY